MRAAATHAGRLLESFGEAGLPFGRGYATQIGMALSEKDLDAIRVLVREEVRGEVQPLRTEIREQFSEVQAQFDGLYKRDEKREEEYIVIREQIGRLEERVDTLERKPS